MISEKMEKVHDGKRVAVFTTTHQTLKAEKLFKEMQIRVRPVPRPRRILSECGLALQFYAEDEERLLDLCQEHHMDLIGTFPYSV